MCVLCVWALVACVRDERVASYAPRWRYALVLCQNQKTTVLLLVVVVVVEVVVVVVVVVVIVLLFCVVILRALRGSAGLRQVRTLQSWGARVRPTLAVPIV